MTLPKLLEMRTAVDAEIMARSAGAGAGAGAGAKKAKKPKRASQGSAWADFTKMIVQEKVADYTAFKEASESKLGVAPRFVVAYRKEHEAEWLAFQTTWNAAHPKAEKGSASSASSVATSAAEESASADEGSVASEKVAKRRGPKKLADMTPEERAAHDAAVEKRREAKKAPSAAAAAAAAAAAPVVLVPVPVAAPVAVPVPSPAASVAPVPSSSPAAEDEESGMVQRVFTLDGQKFLRIWDEGANAWAAGDLWIAKAIGSGQHERGDYVGELMEDGSINTDAEEPTFE